MGIVSPMIELVEREESVKGGTHRSHRSGSLRDEGRHCTTKMNQQVELENKRKKHELC